MICETMSSSSTSNFQTPTLSTPSLNTLSRHPASRCRASDLHTATLTPANLDEFEQAPSEDTAEAGNIGQKRWMEEKTKRRDEELQRLGLDSTQKHRYRVMITNFVAIELGQNGHEGWSWGCHRFAATCSIALRCVNLSDACVVGRGS